MILDFDNRGSPSKRRCNSDLLLISKHFRPKYPNPIAPPRNVRIINSTQCKTLPDQVILLPLKKPVTRVVVIGRFVPIIQMVSFKRNHCNECALGGMPQLLTIWPWRLSRKSHATKSRGRRCAVDRPSRGTMEKSKSCRITTGIWMINSTGSRIALITISEGRMLIFQQN